MIDILTQRDTAVMTLRAIVDVNTDMIEYRADEAVGGMTYRTILGGGNMTQRFTQGNRIVMAGSTIRA